MSKKAKLFWIAAVCFTLFFVAFVAFDGLDRAQKAINPVAYWKSKRNAAQEMTYFYSNEVRWCQLEIERLSRTRDTIIRQSILAGSTVSDAEEEFRLDWEATIETCSIFRGILAKEQAELDLADAELSKLK